MPRLRERPAQTRKPGQPGWDWPWTSAYVTHEGVVQPCCMVMGSDRAHLGDLRTSSFLQIWSSDDYARFREGLLSAADPPPVCRGCSMYRGLF